MKIAIVCDWLIGGGAERVVAETHKLYPEAPIYTSYINDAQRQAFKGADVRPLWTQSIPFSGHLRKFIGLFRELAFSRLDLSEYDVVISLTGAEAKGVRVPDETVHICYCHAPTHYYWVRYDEYMKHPGFGIFDPVARLGLKVLIKGRRKWDYQAAHGPDILIANSHVTRKRIKKYYHRDSEIIFPPVNTERFTIAKHPKRERYLVVGRQTPYKRIDLAVQACTLLGLPLDVVGNGPEHKKLQRLAGNTVTFYPDVSDREIARFYQHAKALIFPSDEDFGITPLEAMASGSPVIAYHAGGALDTVLENKTGLFFEQQSVESLTQTLADFEKHTFDTGVLRKHARTFDATLYRKQMSRTVKAAARYRPRARLR